MSKFSCGVATFIKNGSNQKLQNKTKTRDIKLSFSFLGQLEVGSSALFINERPEQCANTRHQSCQHLRYHLGTALEQQMKDQQGDERSHPYHSIITTGLLLCNCLFVFIKEEQVGSRLLFFFFSTIWVITSWDYLDMSWNEQWVFDTRHGQYCLEHITSKNEDWVC